MKNLIDKVKRLYYEKLKITQNPLSKIDVQKAVQLFVVCLKSKDTEVRDLAVETLIKIGKTATDLLIKFLADEDWQVRKSAAKVLQEIDYKPSNENEKIIFYIAKLDWDELVKIGEPAIEPLIICLKDKECQVRKSAIECLGKINAKQAVDPLIECLKDENMEVCTAAIESLGKIGDKKAIEPLLNLLNQENRDLHNTIIDGLISIGEATVIPLINNLRNGNTGIFEHAEEILTKIGGTAVKPLIECIGDKNRELCKFAEKVLEKIGKPAIEPLIDSLRDKDFRNKDLSVCESVMKILANIGEPAVEPLIACFRDRDISIRKNAENALIKIGEQATKPLIVYLKDEDEIVRKHSADALEKIGYEPITNDDKITYFIAGKKWDELVKIRDSAVIPLIDCLNDKNDWIRKSATECLGKIGSPKAIEPLIKMFKDEEEKVSKAAVIALAEIGQPAIEPLISCIKGNNANAREYALETLKKIGQPAVDSLISCLTNDNPDVRESVAMVLGQIGDKRAIEPLVLCLKDKIANIQKAAADALEKLNYKPSNQDEEIIYCIAKRNLEEIKKIGPPAVDPLIRCLKDENPLVRSFAAKSLGEIRDKRSVESLIVCLSDKDFNVAVSAAISLKNLDYEPSNLNEKIIYLIVENNWEELVGIGEPAVERLISCLQNKNYKVRKSDAEALGKIGDKRAVPYLINVLPDWDTNSQICGALESLGWNPQGNEEKVYYWIGKEDKQNLNSNWELTKKVLLNDLKNGDISKMENAAFALINLGRDEIISDLIKALKVSGSERIANAFWRCGNKELRGIAEERNSKRDLLTIFESMNGIILETIEDVRWGKWKE